ncbi:hypothetical protein [Ralstonia solanacearum]|uniref:hypothetical protein n=1 Tax=Ralstonia solanacearum TaxID=305 RepID=UPI0012D3FA48|nr:hypothetical protein [Ralstonia solanacearum]MCL9827808.1 hypothetical protein [Ralstonia solanacearum]QJC23929.1 hypothetical protein G8D25_07305 [Ralstonia solanacearum]
MENEGVVCLRHFSFAKVICAIGFLLFAWYTDILALQAPFFACFVCPPILVVRLVFLALKRVGVRWIILDLILGFPAILILVSVSSVALSHAHDRWIMGEVRAWGGWIRNEKSVSGKFPMSKAISFHGYPAAFISYDKSPNPPVIIFNKFGGMRQVYSVINDQFFEETEL